MRSLNSQNYYQAILEGVTVRVDLFVSFHPFTHPTLTDRSIKLGIKFYPDLTN